MNPPPMQSSYGMGAAAGVNKQQSPGVMKTPPPSMQSMYGPGAGGGGRGGMNTNPKDAFSGLDFGLKGAGKK